MKRTLLFCAALLLCSCSLMGDKDSAPGLPDDARASYRGDSARLDSEYRGWDFVVEKLREKDISESDLDHIYKNARMPRFEHIRFSLAPRESEQAYSRHLAADRLARGRSFMSRNRQILRKTQASYGVSEHIITAILLIESDFGRNTGSDLAIHRLSRLVATADPENQEWNYQRLRRENSKVSRGQVKDRARYLEELFLPEIIALIEISRENQIDIFEIKGSRAGALGMPQFLPTTYRKYAQDGDEDGRISLFREPDAVWSVGNYLQAQGWKSSRSWEKNREALWEYNRSEAYVNSVLKVAAALASSPGKTPAASRKSTASKPKPVSDFSIPDAESEDAAAAQGPQPSLSEKMRDAITDWSQQNSF